MADSKELVHIVALPEEKRKRIREGVIAGLSESFPIKSRSKTLEVSDVAYQERTFTPSEQRAAILQGDTLYENVKGTLTMKDADGKVIDRLPNFTLARIPWLTDRHTIVVGGNEYSVSNQVRPKAGVYTRKRANGMLESNFNTRTGSNFNIIMDPVKGTPQLEYSSAKIPLYPILRAGGLTHTDIAKAWGDRLADQNQKTVGAKQDKALAALYRKMVPEYHRAEDPSVEEMTKEIFARYAKQDMDPTVNAKTIGKAHANVTPHTLLDASKKLLNIYRNAADSDDRDSLDFKAIYGIDDFFKERIKLDARDIGRKAVLKMEATPELRKALPSGPFTGGILRFINGSTLVTAPAQTNPMDLLDSASRITAMGEGGISSERAIPMETRMVHATHIGAIDPFRTPESFLAGVDRRAARGVAKDIDNNIYVPLIDVATGKQKHVRAGELQDQVVAFPHQELKGTVDALQNGQIRKVPASRVKYQMPHPAMSYSATTQLIPFIESLQGNRSVMGSKMQTQALSLVEREAPYVQVMGPQGKPVEEEYAWMTNAQSPVTGKVVKIDGEHIYVRPHTTKESEWQEKDAAKKDPDADLVKVPYLTNFPLAAKTHLTQTPIVSVGDTVTPKTQLTESNFTKDGRMALGKNMSVAYMPYYGANSNDAIVVSEGAAKKLTSERMYKVVIPRDLDLTLDANKHRAYYGQLYTKDQYGNLTSDGLIKPGTIVKPGDPLVAALRKSTPSSDDILLGRLHKSLVKPFREQTEVWNHEHEGEVIDVVKTPKRVAITIKTREPIVIGDKLCYTQDTEILTSSGWVPVAEVTKGHICYTLNGSGNIELHAPEELHHYPSAGFLYELDTQQVKLRVTPNHRLYVAKRDSREYNLVPAVDVMGKRVRHKKNGNWLAATPETFTLPTASHKDKGKGSNHIATVLPPIPTLAWCRFLGAYLANGSSTKVVRRDRNDTIEYRTSIHTIKGQRHSVSGDQHTWIGQLIDACGIPSNPREDRYIITLKQVAEYLLQFGHAIDKYIPEEVFTWGADAAEAFLEGLMGCDGSRTHSNSYQYHTVSQKLADGVMRLALHAGLAANVTCIPLNNPDWHDRYLVKLVYAKLHPQVNHGHSKTQNGQSEKIVPSVEPVWGITVPNHTLYVRVKGTPVWSGNSARYGNKGVVSEIVPDAEMVKDESGKPIDIVLTSAGVVSRANPAQIIESAVGKVVEKTGKPIVVENLTGRDNVQWAKDLLKKHGIKDKEDLFDPRSGKTIPQVFVGRQYMLKLMKTTESNFSGRGTEGGYDVNQQPVRGGEGGSKAFGKMEFDALVSHNARSVAQEAAVLKGQKNDEYWRAVQLGYPTPPLKTPFAYEKLMTMLTGAGVKVNREGSTLTAAPLTDEDTLKMSSGEIKEPTLIKAKNFAPETGGLFDPAVTGGLTGTKWGHIKLVEPVVSPVCKEPVRRLLGMTETELEQTIAEKGGRHIQAELKKIDLDAKEKELRKSMKTKSAESLDNEVKQLKYIQALRRQGLTPDKAYTVSVVPVVPPVVRPVIPGRGGQEIMYGDINPLYRDLLYTNNQFKDLKRSGLLPSEEKKLRPALQQAVGAVYGTDDPVSSKSRSRGHQGFLTYIGGTNSPKYGFFHDKILKRRQDLAGRGTIVPDNTLSMDEIGVPEEMLWEMYSPFIVKNLVATGYPALEAKEMVKKRDYAARQVLLKETQERPVMFNRAPTLHRYSILGAYPKPMPGKTIRISPFVETPLGADYDGDTMMLHVPTSPKAIEEVKGMTMSQVLYGDKNRSELYAFPGHEAIMGVAHASNEDKKNPPKVFKTKAEADQAYKEGKIGIGTRVKIEEH